MSSAICFNLDQSKISSSDNWLTLSQTTNFRLYQTQRVCRWWFQIWWKWQKVLKIDRKYCGKRRNCLLRAIFPFPTVFSKGLYCLGKGKSCKNIGSFSKLWKFMVFSNMNVMYFEIQPKLKTKVNLNLQMTTFWDGPCWKHFADNKSLAECNTILSAYTKLNVAKMMWFVSDMVENIVWNGENAGYQYILHFPQWCQKTFFKRLLKDELV